LPIAAPYRADRGLSPSFSLFIADPSPHADSPSEWTMQLTATNPVVAAAARKPVSSLPDLGGRIPDLGGRIPELDGLRGLAIGMVLLSHYFLTSIQSRPGSLVAYLLAPGRLAWSGVDLFFVLSGFLIGGILLDARHSSNYFRVFYTRRFFRIIPIYIFCLVAALILYCLADSGTGANLAWMRRDPLPWIPYTLFLQNFWMAYASTFGAFGFAVTWSLAVEEQFYLTLPMLVHNLRPPRLLAALAVGILAAPALRIAFYILWPERWLCWHVLMPCRADALLLGVLGAVAMRNPACRDWLSRNRQFSSILLLLLLCGMAVLTLRAPAMWSPLMLSVGYTWMALFYLSLLLYALVYRESWMARCMRWRWLGWLGTIAYGTYLFHELIRGTFFGLLGPRPPQIQSAGDFLLSVLALAVTLLICQLSWRYFEKPLIQIGHRARYEVDEFGRDEALPTLRVEGAISK
jgi:peptidoglycan/LPS O-acetylase OafA/YrhL